MEAVAELPGVTRTRDARIPGLDEIRGIAASIVVVQHGIWMLPWFPEALVKTAFLGPFGVDIFFIVSGYLIGRGLLLARGRLFVQRNFYVKRFFRIAPLALVLIAASVIASLITGRSLESLPYYFLFLQNFVKITSELPSTDPNWHGMMLGLDPMWSLAVEEQFYLIIPFILLMFPRRSIPWVIALIAVVSLAFRTFDSAIPDGLLYANPRLTHERIHFLALGVLVALGSRAHVGGIFACWVGLLLLSGARNGQLEIPAALGVVVYLGFVLEGRAFLIGQHIGEIGRLCYGIYLLHYPIQVGMKLIVRSPGWLACMGLFGVYVVCTYAAAKISFKYFESPFQQFGRKYLRG